MCKQILSPTGSQRSGPVSVDNQTVFWPICRKNGTGVLRKMYSAAHPNIQCSFDRCSSWVFIFATGLDINVKFGGFLFVLLSE